ncbi:hypothetical protein BSF44_10050 [Pseudomonas sp. ACN8]|nr:hypothetical protein BSF44_10050 [Pseudomonas sp. ACN8]
MLAMLVNDETGCLTPRGDLRFFASRLAPTVDLRCLLMLAQPLDKQRKQLRLRPHLQFQVQVLAVHAHGFR